MGQAGRGKRAKDVKGFVRLGMGKNQVWEDLQKIGNLEYEAIRIPRFSDSLPGKDFDMPHGMTKKTNILVLEY